MATVPLAYSEDGPAGGPGVVLLHGSPTDRGVWAPQAAALAAEGLRVVRPDLRGHGQSPLGEGPSTVEAMAGDVVALADSLAMAEFILGGFSFGGWVAMEIARTAPTRVRALLLVSTGARPDSAKEAAGRAEQAQRVRSEGVHVDDYRERVLAPTTLASRPEVWAQARRSMAEVSAEGRARAIERMGSRPDFRPLLKDVGVPALVVAGQEDPVTPTELAREMHELIAGSFLQVVHGASHFVTLEAPGVVNQAVVNWLAWSGLLP